MVFLFRRAAEVRIGKQGSDGKLIKNLRIQFMIKKGASSTLNNSTINVFNLNRDSRGFIEGEDNTAILSVGYRDISGNRLLNDIFKGTISRVEHIRTNANIISKLLIIDGKKEIDVHIEENFLSGTRTESVLRVVLKKFGLNAASINKIINSVKNRGISNLSKQYLNGLALTGNFKEVMKKIMDKEDIDFSIQDGTVLIDKDIVIQSEAVLINKDTGMIGIPVKKEEGIEIVTLIQSGIVIGGTISLQSELINGFFKVRQIVYNGDTHQNKWEMKIIVK